MENIIVRRKNKVIYRDGDKCVKLFEAGYSKADIFNEALNQARIEETGLNVPKILGVTMIDGQWAIVSEFIEGKTLAQLIQENPDQKDAYLAQLVDIQLTIHAKNAPLLNMLKDKLHRKISASGLDATTRYDLHTQLEGLPKHKKVCHGDLRPSNIIITPEGVPYILDWSHAAQGNASSDTAETYLTMCMAGDREGAEKYLELFCQKSDTAKQYVQKWMPIVAAARLNRCEKEQQEFLRTWVNVVDYQ